MKLHFYSREGRERNYAYQNSGEPTLTISVERIDIADEGRFYCFFTNPEAVEKAKEQVGGFTDNGDINPFEIENISYVTDGVNPVGLILKHNGKKFRIAD